MRTCRTGKRRYGDRIAALLALADTSRSGSERRNEIRAYRCPDCQGWHLSSKAAYERPRLARWEAKPKRKYSPPRLEVEPTAAAGDDAESDTGTGTDTGTGSANERSE